MGTELSGRPGRATRELVAEPGTTDGSYRWVPPRCASCQSTDSCWKTCSCVAQLPETHSGNLGKPQICRLQLLLHSQDPCRKPGTALLNPFLSTGTATEDSTLIPRGRRFLADPPGGNQRVHPHLLNNPRQQSPLFNRGGRSGSKSNHYFQRDARRSPLLYSPSAAPQLMTPFPELVRILQCCRALSKEAFAAEPKPRG